MRTPILVDITIKNLQIQFLLNISDTVQNKHDKVEAIA